MRERLQGEVRETAGKIKCRFELEAIALVHRVRALHEPLRIDDQ
jgi:hypothetical protein